MQNTLAVSNRYHERGVKRWETSTTGDCATWGHRSRANTKMASEAVMCRLVIQFFLASLLIGGIGCSLVERDQSKDKIKQLNNQARIETAR